MLYFLMNLKIYFILLFLILIVFGAPVDSKDDYSPGITLEQAIRKAQEYVAENDIDLSGKYMNTAMYHNNMQNRNQQAYWTVIWVNRLVTKGGAVELRLYTDGSIEVKYHK